MRDLILSFVITLSMFGVVLAAVLAPNPVILAVLFALAGMVVFGAVWALVWVFMVILLGGFKILLYPYTE